MAGTEIGETRRDGKMSQPRRREVGQGRVLEHMEKFGLRICIFKLPEDSMGAPPLVMPLLDPEPAQPSARSQVLLSLLCKARVGSQFFLL